MLSDEEFHQRRAEALKRILESKARKKLIVAGPGTGKTYTFQQVLVPVAGRGLAMTFLLGLVRDLKDAIGADADVYSFHGFARRLLHQIDGTGVSHGVHYYPPLTRLLLEDLRIVEGATVDALALGGLFRNLAENEPFLIRALSCGSYYDAVSFDDAVFRVLRAMRADERRVPVYPQIVVDEFQDFCPLEVEFVRQLAKKSPILIVGDDDQALYAFRDATPDAIRELATNEEYELFELPYCTRCTQVIVDATHTVVARARALHLLDRRLDKPYDCFLPEKRHDSANYPKIIHARCSIQTNRAPYMGQYIEGRIRDISDAEIEESRSNNYPTVLIIGPNPFLTQIGSYLRGRFNNIATSSSDAPELSLLDAYRFLAHDADSNLGWRILLQLLRPGNWEAPVRRALANDERLCSLLPQAFINDQLEIVELLKRLDAEAPLSNNELEVFATALGVDPMNVGEILNPSAPTERQLDLAEPTIMLTSLLGSKGLQAAHVFIVGVNQGHFPRRAVPTNAEVCQLLVALTRTSKSCTLVSTGRLAQEWLTDSSFVRWLEPHIETVTVNRQYFSAQAD
jgi:hypothetical protein